MAKGRGFCSSCYEKLTLENTAPCHVRTGKGYCWDCRRKRDADNKDYIRERTAKWARENKQRVKENRIKYTIKNRSYISERQKKYQLKNKGILLEKAKLYFRCVLGRYKTVKRCLKKDGVVEQDLLWHFNFYSALISDAVCHYCLGPLNATGGGLDRIENNIGHTCYNVVPCCRKCNRIKGNDTSYDEMMLLAPALREIVRLKSLTQ